MIDYEFHEFMIERFYAADARKIDDEYDDEYDDELEGRFDEDVDEELDDKELDEDFDWRNEPACWTPD